MWLNLENIRTESNLKFWLSRDCWTGVIFVFSFCFFLCFVSGFLQPYFLLLWKDIWQQNKIIEIATPITSLYWSRRKLTKAISFLERRDWIRKTYGHKVICYIWPSADSCACIRFFTFFLFAIFCFLFSSCYFVFCFLLVILFLLLFLFLSMIISINLDPLKQTSDKNATIQTGHSGHLFLLTLKKVLCKLLGLNILKDVIK